MVRAVTDEGSGSESFHLGEFFPAHEMTAIRTRLVEELALVGFGLHPLGATLDMARGPHRFPVGVPDSDIGGGDGLITSPAEIGNDPRALDDRLFPREAAFLKKGAFFLGGHCGGGASVVAVL